MEVTKQEKEDLLYRSTDRNNVEVAKTDKSSEKEQT